MFCGRGLLERVGATGRAAHSVIGQTGHERAKRATAGEPETRRKPAKPATRETQDDRGDDPPQIHLLARIARRHSVRRSPIRIIGARDMIPSRGDDSMKNKTSPDLIHDLRPHYGAELFRTMQPNRFAGTDLKFKGRRAVYLDADVAEVFDTPEAVNTVLRSAIRAMRRAALATSKKTVRAKPRAS